MYWDDVERAEQAIWKWLRAHCDLTDAEDDEIERLLGDRTPRPTRDTPPGCRFEHDLSN